MGDTNELIVEDVTGISISCSETGESVSVELKGSFVPTIVRRLRDLDGQKVFLLDQGSTATEPNTILYSAVKDILPKRNVGTTTAHNWRSDLTIYPAGDLASTELRRSTGHRNGPNCVELFEVWFGAVRMYMEVPRGDGRTDFVYADAFKGETIVVPPGSWHSIHVLEGPAIVFDIYTRQPFVELSAKPYFEELGMHTFFRENGRVLPLKRQERSQDTTNLLSSIPACPTETLLPGYSSLAEFFANASMPELEAFVDIDSSGSFSSHA